MDHPQVVELRLDESQLCRLLNALTQAEDLRELVAKARRIAGHARTLELRLEQLTK